MKVTKVRTASQSIRNRSTRLQV